MTHTEQVRAPRHLKAPSAAQVGDASGAGAAVPHGPAAQTVVPGQSAKDAVAGESLSAPSEEARP
ncbi:hypothetical protein [Streptomyces cinereospinus]|uniref:Uncharacterized protein n=1 Tax=Streptomyces cinereospinus TaxID=285561 RepID=A0ABV5MZD9_9ACTN